MHALPRPRLGRDDSAPRSRPGVGATARLAALLAALSLVGCAQLGALGDALEPYTPKVSFQEMALQSIDFSGIAVDLIFRIDNPNPLSVKLDSFSYAFGLEGVEFLKGTNDDGIALEARGASQMSLPLSLRYQDIFDLVGAVSGKDDLGFSFAGDFGFRTPVGVARVPFREEGRLPVVRPPDVSLEGLRMGRLDILAQTATLNLDVGFTPKDGGAPLRFAGFDYRVNLGQNQVAAGLVDHVAEAVAANARQVVTIPLNLNLRSLGSAVVDAITRKTALDVGLGATLMVGTPFGDIPLSIDESGRLSIF